MYRMTAAHKELPLPCYVRVTNLENGRSTVLKVNDRGPFHDNRVIDLSYAAALKLGVTEKGTAFVEVVAVNGPSERATPTSPPSVAQIDSAGTAPATHQMFLQIGAFSERPNAERLSDRVGKHVPAPVHVFESLDGGRPLYRVQVGPIATVDSADHLVTTLFGLGILEHHVVAN
jgi:rare lipoprotein A